jgi:hypothetical protein
MVIACLIGGQRQTACVKRCTRSSTYIAGKSTIAGGSASRHDTRRLRDFG